MITFDKDNEIFYLNTKNTTYAMEVSGGQYLMHRYWGKRLKNPLNRADSSVYSGRNLVPFDMPLGNSDVLPLEYSGYGNADMRIPSAEFTFADGSRVSRLTYKGYEILDGKPALEGLPATYCEEGDKVDTLVIHLEDTYQNVDVFLSYSVFEDLDAITRSTRIVNRGERMLLDSAMSATVDFYGSPEQEILNLAGAWTRERHITRQPVVYGNQGIDSRYGCSSAMHNPFIALCDKNATENHGNVYGFNLVYSGNFTAGAEKNAYNGTRAYIGINPTNFQFVLEKGESFQTPEAVLVYSAKGLGEMSRIYHKLYRTRLCRGKYRDTERFVLINNWEATYFYFDEDKIVAIAEKAAKVGIDTLVLDAGWLSCRINDSWGLGDRSENRGRRANGYAGLSKRINDLGMRFGLWFEPEMVNPGTELIKNHPDWIIHTEGRESYQVRNQYTLDLSREDVCDYIIDTLSGILSRANIEYVKWDMNRYMSAPGSALLDGARQGEVMHRYILGLYRVLETITQRFPNILFESCASGGSRFDAGMLKGLLDTNKRLKDAMLFNILSFMSNQLLGKGNSAASIDELYLFLTNMPAIEYIRNAMKRVRKKDSSIILASQNIEDFLIPTIREYTKPLFSIPTHQFLFNAGQINPKEYMDALQVEPSEFELIKYPERGTCLYRCGNERYLLQVIAPEYKSTLFGKAGGR